MFKLRIVNHATGKTIEASVATPEQLNALAQEYGIHPRQIVGATLEDSVRNLAVYLSRFHMDATVEQVEPEVLKKAADMPPDLYQQYQPQLQAIAHNESSDHRAREHARVMKGVHMGTQSISSYGVMPIGAHELATKDKEFGKTPTGQAILHAAQPQPSDTDPYAKWARVAEVTRDQNHDNNAAAAIWNYHRNRISKFAPAGADLDAMTAYAHRKGVTATFVEMKKPNGYQNILNHPYVKSFLEKLKK